MKDIRFVGLDVHKESTAVAVAEAGWGEPRNVGVIPTRPDALARLVRKLGGKEGLVVAYEAGPCGYGIYRQLRAMGVECRVVAPSLIPRRPGDRVKTDSRDARQLARLLRGGDLTPVWVPDEEHEALRDLVRAREDAKRDLGRKRHQLDKFPLRNDVRPPERVRAWSRRHREWLEGLKPAQPAQGIVLAESLRAVREAEDRISRLETELSRFAERSAQAPVIRAPQALRGVSLITAVGIVAELGDITRFDRPEKLMSYAGLVPSEYSSGSSRHQGGHHQDRQQPSAVAPGRSRLALPSPTPGGRGASKRQDGLPEEVKRIAWNARMWLNHKFRRLLGRGKPSGKAAVAVARELLGFIWAKAHEVSVSARRRTDKMRRQGADGLPTGCQVLIDHVLIGPPGAYLVLFEPCGGVVRGARDAWARKRGDSSMLLGRETPGPWRRGLRPVLSASYRARRSRGSSWSSSSPEPAG